MKLSACRSASRRVSEFAWGWVLGSTAISGSAEASFQELPYLGSVDVHIRKHVVYLSGPVSAGLMSRTAAEIAHETPNVEQAVNTIWVTK